MDRAESQVSNSQVAYSDPLGAVTSTKPNNDGPLLGREDSNLQSPDPESGNRESGALSTEDGALGAPVLGNQATVVNVKVVGRRGCDVFIGRPSKWGNPYIIGLDGDRAEVIAKYREWITQHPTLDPRELRGKVLGCFCAPLPCHGDVLAELAEAA